MRSPRKAKRCGSGQTSVTAAGWHEFAFRSLGGDQAVRWKTQTPGKMRRLQIMSANRVISRASAIGRFGDE
jgi:hypothetical protein